MTDTPGLNDQGSCLRTSDSIDLTPAQTGPLPSTLDSTSRRGDELVLPDPDHNNPIGASPVSQVKRDDDALAPDVIANTDAQPVQGPSSDLSVPGDLTLLTSHSTPTPQAITVIVNGNAPVITSSDLANAPENVSIGAPIYRVTATDATTGATLTYSITGGADKDLFNIDSHTGNVTFKVSPDFERPSDSNGDHVYNIIVQADDGQANASQNVAITLTDVAEAKALKGDFNGDGASDVLLQLSDTGDCYLWSLNKDKSLHDTGYVGWRPGPDWHAAGVGDFNADGHSDILLQNQVDGACYIWETDGKNLIDYGYVGWAPGTDWAVRSVADFNGDGYSDILLQNKTDGTCFVWELNSKTMVDAGFVGWAAGPQWQVKGTGDFNGDGKSDILLQNTQDGSCFIWEMNGKIVIDSGAVGWTAGVQWQVKGTGDFNGDGKSDILLQNTQDGTCFIWELNGKTLVGSGLVGWAPPSTQWQVKEVGDFNGDGKSDILLQNADNGACFVWELNDKALVDSGYVGWTPGSHWLVSA